MTIKSVLQAVLLTVTVSSPGFAEPLADLLPISLSFKKIPAHGGDFPEAAVQEVYLKVKNIGNTAVGKTKDELCGNASLCNNYNVLSAIIAGHIVQSAMGFEWEPGETRNMRFLLPYATLGHCRTIQIAIDTNQGFGQFPLEVTLQNDSVQMQAFDVDSHRPCLVSPPVPQ